MEKRVTQSIRLEGAYIFYRNFSGKVSENNKSGERNFAVALPEEMVEDLLKDGWNVKRRKPNADGYEQPYLPVKVKFGKYPPIAWMINKKGKLKLDESNIGELDYCIVQNCDLIIRPYNYEPSAIKPNGGVAAYLKAIYVTIADDSVADNFAGKYADVPELN